MSVISGSESPKCPKFRYFGIPSLQKLENFEFLEVRNSEKSGISEFWHSENSKSPGFRNYDGPKTRNVWLFAIPNLHFEFRNGIPISEIPKFRNC